MRRGKNFQGEKLKFVIEWGRNPVCLKLCRCHNGESLDTFLLCIISTTSLKTDQIALADVKIRRVVHRLN